jgi:hypothetical protein
MYQVNIVGHKITGVLLCPAVADADEGEAQVTTIGSFHRGHLHANYGYIFKQPGTRTWPYANETLKVNTPCSTLQCMCVTAAVSG